MHDTPSNQRRSDWVVLATSPEILFVFLVSILITLLTPNDVLEKSPLLSAFVDTVSGWFPTIHRYQRASAYPQVTGLYFSVQSLITPVLFISPFRLVESTSSGYQKALHIHPIRLRLASALITPASLLLLIGQYFFGLDIHLNYFDLGTSKLSLALGGWIFFAGAAWLATASALIFLKLLLNLKN